MISKLNIRRYSELLKKRESHEITAEEMLEFREYQILLEYEVAWKTKKDYLQLAKNFINSIIDGNEFILKFFALRRYDDTLSNDVEKYLVEKQIFLEPTLKFKGFLTLLNDLFFTLDLYDEDAEGFELNTFIVSNEGLKYYLKETFIPELEFYIQQEDSFLKEENGKNQIPQLKSCSQILKLIVMEKETLRIYQDNQVLKSTMFLLTSFTSIGYLLLKPGLLNFILNYFN